MRLSIDVSDDEHRKLKALAALSGESLKSYILKRVLPPQGESAPPDDEAAALAELEGFLAGRIEAVERAEFSDTSVSTIFEDELRGS
ncbi:MAG: antitoxin [Pseudomonadota bacterium]